MDSRQRYNDPEEMLHLALQSILPYLWTGIPGYIVDFDATKITATVQIGIKANQVAPDESVSQVQYPVLNDVPVIFPGGGGARLTFPIAKDDECWIMFSSRAMGAWKQQGGIQPANDPRKFHMSDAVCLVGPMSQSNKIANVSTATTQLRSNDGSTYVELDAQGQIVNIVAPGGVTMDAPTFHLKNGAMTVDKTITAEQDITSSNGDVLAGSISLQQHTHPVPGVQSGSSTATTQPPQG